MSSRAPEQVERWMVGTLGTNPRAGKPDHDKLARGTARVAHAKCWRGVAAGLGGQQGTEIKCD